MLLASYYYCNTHLMHHCCVDLCDLLVTTIDVLLLSRVGIAALFLLLHRRKVIMLACSIRTYSHNILHIL